MKHFYIANLFIIDVEKSSGSLSVSQGELQVERSEEKKKFDANRTKIFPIRK